MALVYGLALTATLTAAQAAAPAAHHDGLTVTMPMTGQPDVDSGLAVVEVVSDDDADLAVVGAVRTSVDGERLLAWFHEIEQLQRSAYIPLIKRFSNPPQLSDVATLVLDDEELEALRECEPGRCKVKLSATEIGHITSAIAGAGDRWKSAAQDTFRQIVLSRARDYLTYGFSNSAYEDHKKRVTLGSEFVALVDSSNMPDLLTADVADHLRRYPYGQRDRSESFLFWSKDVLGDAKPIVGITHINLFKGSSPDELTVVAAVQVYATHYVTASLSLTAIVPAPDGVTRYLVYARRSRVDVFRGMFGELLRRIVKKRLRAEGPPLLEGLRRKLESGFPSIRDSR
jgi:hypothetical protein